MIKDRTPKYMMVGEVAEKMGVSVRTLQYYDKEGLLSPSAQSEGGRRLYTDKDLVTLHQILSLKSLGFSLSDIKERLFSLDTPEDVAKVLEEQANDIRQKIIALTASLAEIEQLREEILQMQEVDFKKYADIIVNLQMKNEFYYVIKQLDDETLDHFRRRFDKKSGQKFLDRMNDLNDKIDKLQKKKVPPESKHAQKLAKAYWELVMEITNGDMSMLPKLIEAANQGDSEKEIVSPYLEKSLEVYFSNLGTNPFEGGKNE